LFRLQQGLFVTSLICIPVGICWYFTSFALQIIGVSEHIAELAGKKNIIQRENVCVI
jgi:hypothetical protein